MKITKTEVFVLGDPEAAEVADGSRVHGLAFVRLHTDEGITGLSEIFCVPPGVARAVLDGPESLFGRLLHGEDPVTPERLWTRLYNSMLHGNRRGWGIICLGAVGGALVGRTTAQEQGEGQAQEGHAEKGEQLLKGHLDFLHFGSFRNRLGFRQFQYGSGPISAT